MVSNLCEAMRALKAVKVGAPEAIVAGGFLRDLIACKPPKDIDIFVEDTHFDFERIGASETIIGEYIGGEVSRVWSLEGYEYPVQIIELVNGLDVRERAFKHDFGMCQVYHDGGSYHWSDLFARDYIGRTFTLDQCEDPQQWDRSMRRWERLSAKFPEYTLVVPEQFQHFAAAEFGLLS